MVRAARSILSLNRAKEVAILTRLLELGPEHRLLDVGCGDGFWTARFARHAREVVGMDIDERMIAYARAHHSRRNLRFERGSALNLAYEDGSFDRVVAVSAVEHFPDSRASLKEMTRVLKPGGIVALSVDSLIPNNSSPTFRSWHSRRHCVNTYYDAVRLREELSGAGLGVEESSFEELFTSRVGGALRALFIRYPRILLPIFPIFLAGCRLADALGLGGRIPGQILIGRGWKIQ